MSQASLEAHRTRLLTLRDRLTNQITEMIEQVPDLINPPGDASTVPTHNADRDTEGLEKEVALVNNEEGILEQVRSALSRIDEGTYGRCTECGREIAEERLKAIPYTPHCIQCAQ